MAPEPITIYDVIVLILHANRNNYTGRTVFQKLTYFWSVCISPIDGVEYGPHYYGPYSPRLRQAMPEMISYAFMDEGVKSGPADDAYHYMLSADGKKFAGRAIETYDMEYRAICRMIRECEELDSIRPDRLSHAARIDYVTRRPGPGMKSDDEILKDTAKLGWSMTKDDVATGRVLLERIKLAARHEAYL